MTRRLRRTDQAFSPCSSPALSSVTCGPHSKPRSNGSSLAEIPAFVVLGLTVPISSLRDQQAWLIGLVLAVLLALVIRPLLIGPLLLAVRLRAGERLFVMWSGLKGAVPILLGTFILGAGTPENTLVYHVIFTVVTFSVIVQAGLVPPIAARCGVPMREVQPLPWSLGIRFRNRPQGVRRYVIGAKAPARGCAIGDLDLDEHVWISSSSVMANPCRCTPAPSSSLEMRSSR